MEGRGRKLLKKSWACFCQVWREECENKGRGSMKKANEFLNLGILDFYRTRFIICKMERSIVLTLHLL